MQVISDQYFHVKNRVVHSVLLRENTVQRKPGFYYSYAVSIFDLKQLLSKIVVKENSLLSSFTKAFGNAHHVFWQRPSLLLNKLNSIDLVEPYLVLRL